MDNEKIFQELLKRSTDGFISYGGTTYKLDPTSKSVIVVGGGEGGTDFPYPTASDDYGTVVRNLLMDTEPDIRDMREGTIPVSMPFTAGPSVSELTYYPEDDPDPLPPSRYAGSTDPVEGYRDVGEVSPTTMSSREAAYRNKQALAAATQKEMQSAQRKDVAGALGPAAILGGIDLAVQLLSKGEDEEYVDEELARLRAMREKGEMGLTSAEKQLLAESQMRPVKGLAREARLRAEAVKAAGMGAVTSARDVLQEKKAQAQGIAEAGRQAGMTFAQAEMAKADQNIKRMEQMIAYKGARAKEKRKAVSSFTGALGAIYGDVVATGAVKPDTGTVRGIYGEAARQGKLLTKVEATKLMRQLRYSPRMNEQKVREIFADAGLPNVSDDFIASITRGSA